MQGRYCMQEVGVVILNYKNHEETAKCVDNLLSFHEKNLLIAIVDNNSCNHSFETLCDKYQKCENVSVIASKKNGGYSYGNNLGISFLVSKYPNLQFFAIMNPDVIIRSIDTFRMNSEILQTNGQLGVLTSIIHQNNQDSLSDTGWDLPSNKKIFLSNTFFLKKILARSHRKEEHLAENIKYVGAVHGSFFMFKKNVLDENNKLFDENVFMYYEENILGFRLKQMQKKAAVNINDIYDHNHQYANQSLKQAQQSAKWRKQSQQYYMKNYLRSSIASICFATALYLAYIYIELPMIKFIKWGLSWKK